MANVARFFGVRLSPTIPLIPDTLIMRLIIQVIIMNENLAQYKQKKG